MKNRLYLYAGTPISTASVNVFPGDFGRYRNRASMVGAGADAVPDPNSGLVSESFALPAACPLCADANVDGVVDPNDVTLIRTELAFPGTLTPAELLDCTDRALSGSCGLLESVIVRRGLENLLPGLNGSCTAVP